MKTVAEIARELGVSKQAVHKKIKQEPLKTRLQGLAVTIDNSLRFDIEGKNLIKSAFGRNELSTALTKQIDNSTILIDESTNKLGEPSKVNVEPSTEIVQILKDEISLLISQNEELRQQLNDERAHNRELTEKMLPLIEQAQKITENAQTLHAMENVRPQLTNGKEKSLWKRLFSKGKRE